VRWGHSLEQPMNHNSEHALAEWIRLVATSVRTSREKMGWTQETLAELAGLTPRTVQRVEAGTSSSPDTRRALARAFELPNIDAFERSSLAPIDERLKSEAERLDRETVALELVTLPSARRLRQLVEAAAQFCFKTIHDAPDEVDELLADLFDRLKEYSECCGLISEVDKRKFDDILGPLLHQFELAGWILAFSLRLARLRTLEGPPLDMSILYLAAAPNGTLPQFVRVPREVKLA
jgi:transcriptional regulator with XRE-family HTH domain